MQSKFIKIHDYFIWISVGLLLGFCQKLLSNINKINHVYEAYDGGNRVMDCSFKNAAWDQNSVHEMSF